MLKLLIVLFFLVGNLLAAGFASKLKFQILAYNTFCFFIFLCSFSNYFSYISLDTEAAFFLLTVNFIFFFILSLVELSLPHPKINNQKKGILKVDYFILTVLIITVAFNIYTNLGSHSLINIFSNVIRDNFINAYLLYFLIFFTSYLFYNGKTKIDLMLSILLLFYCFLLGVKGIVILILFVFIIRLLDYKLNTTLILKLIVISIIGIISFYSSYVIPRVLFEGEQLLDVIYDINQRFIFYAASGPLSFSIDYENGLSMDNISSLYVPFYNGYINIFEKGGVKASYMVNSINSLSIFGTGSYSNVKTLYGTIFLNSGDYKTLNFLVFLAFNILVMVFRRLSNLSFRYTNAALTMYLSCLLVSWFEFYYWHAFLLYGVIYGLILDCLTYFLKKVRYSTIRTSNNHTHRI